MACKMRLRFRTNHPKSQSPAAFFSPILFAPFVHGCFPAYRSFLLTLNLKLFCLSSFCLISSFSSLHVVSSQHSVSSLHLRFHSLFVSHLCISDPIPLFLHTVSSLHLRFRRQQLLFLERERIWYKVRPNSTIVCCSSCLNFQYYNIK